MSIVKQIGTISSLVNMFAGADPVKASLNQVGEDGNEIENLSRAFQYFPEQISDSKGANYASRNIPGGSHPLYQFINGTDRVISFSAIFTSDEDPAPPDILSALSGGLGAQSVLKYAGISKGTNKHSVSADSAVIWLRSFIYPRYSQANTVAPPPSAVLYLPNSGIHGSVKGGALARDSVHVIMTQCDVVYEAFYRGGSQRITVVNLSFLETIQVGSSWQFADGDAFQTDWLDAHPYLVKGNKAPASKDSFNGIVADPIGAAKNFVKQSITSRIG